MKIFSNIDKRSQDRYVCILLILVLVGSAFQNVKVVGPLNPGHLLALCFIPFLLPKLKETKFPPAVICIFTAYILCVSLFASFKWGLDTSIIIICLSFTLSLSLSSWEEISHLNHIRKYSN